MNEVYLSLGSNEGDRLNWIKQSISLLLIHCGKIITRSSVYETGAWGITQQPDFLNMVILIGTAQPPDQVLSTLLKIETALGRHRKEKWGPRIIDLDILFYDQLVLNSNMLTIPHPLLEQRNFILIPLLEIAPGLIHPRLNKTIKELLTECNDDTLVKIYETQL